MKFLDYLVYLQKSYCILQSEILFELNAVGLKISKSNLSHKLKGDRLISEEEFEIILKTIDPTDEEKQELRELYKIYIYGEQNYKEVCRVKDYIESFSYSRTSILSQKTIDLDEITYIGDKNLLDEILVYILSENWGKSPIRILCQPEYQTLIEILSYLGKETSGDVRHIVCLNKESDMDNNVYNINCLINITKLAFGNNLYSVKYFHDKVNSHCNSFSIFPFFIISGERMLLISSDFSYGFLSTDKEFISAYIRDFDRIYNKSEKMFTVLNNDLDYIKTCSFLEMQAHEKYYVLQNKRCLLFGIDKKTIVEYVNKDNYNISEILEIQKQRAENTIPQGFILYNDPDCENFINNGIADDWPEDLCIPIPKEFRSTVILNSQKDPLHKNIQIKKGYIHFPKELMIACYDSGSVLISYKKNLNSPRLVVTERSLYKSIKLFCEYVLRFESDS